MKTTRTDIILLQICFVISLFFTTCLLTNNWQQFLSIGTNTLIFLQTIIAFLLPFILTLALGKKEKTLYFISRATSAFMMVCMLIYYIDKEYFKFIASRGENKILFHFFYSLTAFFAVYLACLILTSKKKISSKSFSDFTKTFYTYYAVFALFLFTLIFVLLRDFNQPGYILNLIPFKGEIGEFFLKLLDGSFSFHSVLYTSGNVLFFTTIAITVCVLIPKKQCLFGILIPAILSLLAEIFQYITMCGDADIDDLILNTAGAVLGVTIYNIFIKKYLLEDTEC